MSPTRRGHSSRSARGRAGEAGAPSSVEELPDEFLLCRRQHPWAQERARWEVESSRGRPRRGVEVLTCPRCGATKRTPFDLVELVQDGSASIAYPPGYVMAAGSGSNGRARRAEVSRERLSRVVAKGIIQQRRRAG